MYLTCTIVTGTNEARQQFDPALSNFLAVHSSTLLVDISLLSTVITPHPSSLNHPSSSQHKYNCIIVVSDAAQLAHALIQLQPDRTDKVLVTGCVSDTLERAAIRILALRYSHCGICLLTQPPPPRTPLPTDNNGVEEGYNDQEQDDSDYLDSVMRSLTFEDQEQTTHDKQEKEKEKEEGRVRQIFDAYMSHWGTCNEEKEKEKEKEEQVQSSWDEGAVWGSPCWTSDHENLVIPPAWDSPQKVRAVVEASGHSFERHVEQRVAAMLHETETERKHMPPTQGDDESEWKTELDEGSSEVRDWLQRHRVWIDRMGELPTGQGPQKEDKKKERRNHADVNVGTQFFQRLLSSPLKPSRP